MSAPKPPRHGPRRPYQPDTGAGNAEEAGARQALARGDVALAPRVDGWVQVFEEDGALTERPILDREGRHIGVWDDQGMSRWMWDGAPRRATWLARLRQRLGLGRAP